MLAAPTSAVKSNANRSISPTSIGSKGVEIRIGDDSRCSERAPAAGVAENSDPAGRTHESSEGDDSGYWRVAPLHRHRPGRQDPGTPGNRLDNRKLVTAQNRERTKCQLGAAAEARNGFVNNTRDTDRS